MKIRNVNQNGNLFKKQSIFQIKKKKSPRSLDRIIINKKKVADYVNLAVIIFRW